MLGSILACLVVFAFMRDWRATVIAAVAIPTSVISTFGLMAALGFTLNTVTMLALVLMVGIVIDDAIVVLENIFRFIEEKGMAPFDAAREATAEIALPVLATTHEPGGDLHPGLVHVEHLGPLPLPVRHHRGLRDPDQPAGVVHADADDERAHVQARQRRTAHDDADSRQRVLRRRSIASTPCVLAAALRRRAAGRGHRRRW